MGATAAWLRTRVCTSLLESALVVLAGCAGDVGTSPWPEAGDPDAGTPGDGGVAGDGGMPADTGAPADTGVGPGDDAGPPPADAGPPPIDAGSPDDDAGRPATDAGAPGTDAGPPRPEPPPADCPIAGETVIYTQESWNVLADAFRDDMSPCVDYFISIPAIAGDKTMPRAAGEAARMRARGTNFHPMAEFHWGGWSREPGTWYDHGVEFRRRMEAAGYRVDEGDTWAVNELPSTVRRDPAARRDAMEALRGLYDGPPGATPARGAVFIIGMAQATVNLTVYKPQIRDWLTDRPFWESVNLHARFWAQEVYADPMVMCVPGTTVGLRAMRLNEYVEHVAHLAEVGPDTANTAQSYLGRAYVPLMNAAWRSPPGAYGETRIPLDQMMHFVSHEVYAARAWSTSHAYPDGRVGFGWAQYDASIDDLRMLAARLASAIHHAYDDGGGSASRACSPSGAYTWCQCSLSGASFNSAWSTFNTW